jgi:hypothetical protein
MRDPGAAHHAVAQAKHNWHVNIFQQIAEIFAGFAREAAPEVDNVGKVEDRLRDRMIEYGSERRMTSDKMEPLNQLLSQNVSGILRADKMPTECLEYYPTNVARSPHLTTGLDKRVLAQSPLPRAAGKALQYRSYS